MIPLFVAATAILVDRNTGETKTGRFYQKEIIANNGFEPLSTLYLRTAFGAARLARFDRVFPDTRGRNAR